MSSPAFGILWRRCAFLAALLLVAIVISVELGASGIGLSALFSGDALQIAVIRDIRLPRVILAALVGGGLAMAGATFQTLLRNPLADPFILGVSGGAASGAAIAAMLHGARSGIVVPLAAFGGGTLATALVYLLGRRGRQIDTVRLLLAGLILNAFFSAVILLAFSFSGATDLVAAMRWMMGTLSGADWRGVALTGVTVAVTLAALAWIASDLRLLAFGEDDAKAKGVEVERTKFIAFFAASLITSAAVAVGGIIGFVGLLVPHGIRLLWRPDYRALLPLSLLGGGILLVCADLLARTAVAPAELPLGAITALIGVPFFLLILRRES
ncbi:MAG: iron ABC transporter permease [Thermoanaerobaculia bacterium]